MSLIAFLAGLLAGSAVTFRLMTGPTQLELLIRRKLAERYTAWCNSGNTSPQKEPTNEGDDPANPGN